MCSIHLVCLPLLLCRIKAYFGHRNWDLHVTSSCHRIKIYSINKTRSKTAVKLKKFEERGIPFLPITQPSEMDLEDEETYTHEMKDRGGRDPLE